MFAVIRYIGSAVNSCQFVPAMYTDPENDVKSTPEIHGNHFIDGDSASAQHSVINKITASVQ